MVSSGGYFVQQSRTILALLEEGHTWKISVKLFKSGHWSRNRYYFFSIFSSAAHFVPRSGTIVAILLEDHPMNIPVKFDFILFSGDKRF